MSEARRKTTMSERKEIVEYCIKHNHDYKGTAIVHDISYRQVYSWGGGGGVKTMMRMEKKV